jgi:hypothetical protein
MKVKKSKVKFEDLPDFITYFDYADWVGIGENLAREKFKSKDFPLLKGTGKKLIASKYAVRDYDLLNSFRKGGKYEL